MADSKNWWPDMPAREHVVENLFLGVQNDGNGDQCGCEYKTRCAVFKGDKASRTIVAQYALDWVKAAEEWCLRNLTDSYDAATAPEILAAAQHVAEYYTEHVKELVA